MIPKIMHHIWMGKATMPESQKLWRAQFIEMHPHWEHRLWTDENTEELGDLLALAKAGSGKANIVRVWAVLKNGGVYADTDFQWYKPLDPLIEGIDGFCCKESRRWYANGLFGSVAESEWLKRIWESMPSYAGRKPPWGPHQFTRFISPTEITTFPTHYFYPYPFSKRGLTARNATYPSAYAAHHWAMSWNRRKKRRRKRSS